MSIVEKEMRSSPLDEISVVLQDGLPLGLAPLYSGSLVPPLTDTTMHDILQHGCHH